MAGAGKVMRVADLMSILMKQDLNMQVWLSRDEEGNGFAPIPLEESFSIADVKPQQWGWTDDVVFPREDDSPVPEGMQRVLIFWPDA